MPTGRTAFQRKPPLYGHYAAIRQTGEQFMDQATLMDKIKTGTTLCKAIMRNGYDAYARLVAGGRCFYVFQLYSRQKTLIHFCTSPLCPPRPLW